VFLVLFVLSHSAIKALYASARQLFTCRLHITADNNRLISDIVILLGASADLEVCVAWRELENVTRRPLDLHVCGSLEMRSD
jgi:hypothetical protein